MLGIFIDWVQNIVVKVLRILMRVLTESFKFSFTKFETYIQRFFK